MRGLGALDGNWEPANSRLTGEVHPWEFWALIGEQIALHVLHPFASLDCTFFIDLMMIR
jgi:hypothetical protein